MISIEVRLFSFAEGNGVQIKAARSLFSVWRSDRTGMKVPRGYLFLLLLSRSNCWKLCALLQPLAWHLFMTLCLFTSKMRWRPTSLSSIQTTKRTLDPLRPLLCYICKDVRCSFRLVNTVKLVPNQKIRKATSSMRRSTRLHTHMLTVNGDSLAS